MGHLEHKAQAPDASGIACGIVTVSDTRTEATDTSGKAIAEVLAGCGHRVLGAMIVRDDPASVATAVRQWLEMGTRVVITTGGTGITSRDSTYEALAGLLHKRLDGFGELFRALSYQEIGSAAMMSRATAGTVGRSALFILPGSEGAVRLAMTRLILPELGHIVQQLDK